MFEGITYISNQSAHIKLKDNVQVDNRQVQKLLAEEGIGTRTFFWCIHEQPVYLNKGFFKNEKHPNAEWLARKGLYIPSGLALSKKQMEKVVIAVKKVLQQIV